MYTINREKCTGCRICVKKCPEGAITMNGRKAEIDADKCTNCGECAHICPFGAIYSDSDSGRSFAQDQRPIFPNTNFGVWPVMRPGMGRGMGGGFGRGFRGGRGLSRGRMAVGFMNKTTPGSRG